MNGWLVVPCWGLDTLVNFSLVHYVAHNELTGFCRLYFAAGGHMDCGLTLAEIIERIAR